MAALGLDRHALSLLIEKVDEELATITTRRHDLLIAGVAAVALLWDERRITNDIDVVSEGMTPQLRDAISRVARDNQLDPAWFNDAAKVAAPRLKVTDPKLVYDGLMLRVYAAPVKYVLAMKLFAARETDKRDIPALMEAAGIQSRQELYDLVTAAYGSHLILPPTAYIIEELWEAYSQRYGST